MPAWVRELGNSVPDIWYTDKEGYRDTEYLSLGADNQALFAPGNRTAIKVYADFMSAFISTFSDSLGPSKTIVTVEVVRLFCNLLIDINRVSVPVVNFVILPINCKILVGTSQVLVNSNAMTSLCWQVCKTRQQRWDILIGVTVAQAMLVHTTIDHIIPPSLVMGLIIGQVIMVTFSSRGTVNP